MSEGRPPSLWSSASDVFEIQPDVKSLPANRIFAIDRVIQRWPEVALKADVLAWTSRGARDSQCWRPKVADVLAPGTGIFEAHVHSLAVLV